MKKNIVISATAVMCTLFSFLFVSCPSGLDPSWKNNNKPIFSLDFSNSSLSDGAGSRALIQGEGFLYIRTVGSATGIKGSFYGPYTVLPGKTFSTTEIPAGSYTGLAVIYSATEANSVKVLWNGEDFTFSQFMNLPDAEFMEVVDAGEEAEEFKMEEFFDSDASGNMIQNVTITAGQENTVKITLEPMVQAGNKGNFEGNDGELQTLDFPLESETVKKQFFALEKAPSGVFSYTTSHHGGENVVIQKTTLYDWRGNFLTTWNSAESIENPNSFDLPTNLENKDLYFYIEYSGEITLEFFVEPIEEPILGQKVSVTFTDLDQYNGEKIFVKLLDTSEFQVIGVGLGSISNGSATILLTAGGEHLIQPLGQGYALAAFVDEGGIYNDITDLDTQTNLDEIMPHFGDLATDASGTGMIPVTASAEDNSITVSALQYFYPTKTHVYFVASTGQFSNTGTRISSAMNLDKALLTSNTIGTDEKAEIFIVDSLTYTPGQAGSLLKPVRIQSLGETSHTITLQNFTNLSPFTVGAGAELSLVSLTIDGDALENLQVPAFNVALGGDLTLENTTISNIHNIESSGGAIAVLGGTVIMNASTITNCSAAQGGGGIYMLAVEMEESYVLFDENSFITSCEAISGAMGGGVYIGENGMFSLMSGTISLCKAENGFGGGVYVEGLLDLGFGPYSITQNTALNGGGIFATSAAEIRDNYTNLTANCISNTATDAGADANIHIQAP